MTRATITIPTKTKERLALLKGRRSWEAFFEDVVQRHHVDDLVKEPEKRVDDVRHDRVKMVPGSDVKKRLER